MVDRLPLGPLDPPSRDGLRNGIGLFVAQDTFQATPVHFRFLSPPITSKSAPREQAFSPDGRKSWVTNWTMGFTRSAA